MKNLLNRYVMPFIKNKKGFAATEYALLFVLLMLCLLATSFMLEPEIIEIKDRIILVVSNLFK